MTLPSIISLCCGAGVAALGYEQVFRTVLAIDNWWPAYLSHLANQRYTPILWEDVSNKEVIDKVCEVLDHVKGVIAAPPCPSFSGANSLSAHERALDPRGWVYVTVVDYVGRLQPDFFICENVPSVQNSFQFLVATAQLERLDYRWEAWVLDAADFGVPQHRVRLFLVAVKKGLPFPSRPIPTHGAADSGLHPYLTLGDAIGDLSEEEALVLGCTKLSYRRSKILSMVPPGGNFRDLPDDLLAETLDSIRWRKPSRQLCGRLDYAMVPGTLRTGPECKASTFPIHPGYQFVPGNGAAPYLSRANVENSASLNTRCLSVIEFLRIQGIRTPFQLHGTVDDRYRQVGNGIPPLLMYAVCSAVRRAVYSVGNFEFATHQMEAQSA